jgi:hypothetical protein
VVVVVALVIWQKRRHRAGADAAADAGADAGAAGSEGPEAPSRMPATG